MEISAWDIILMLAMLVLSGFFSGIEIAFVSASRLKIALKESQEDPKGLLLASLIKKTSRVITTILIGNNLALVLFGISAGKIFTILFLNWFAIDPGADPLASLLLQTFATTLIVLIFGEYLPKAIFRLYPDNLLSFFARFLNVLYRLFGPLVMLISALSKFVLVRIFRLDYQEQEVTIGKTDLHLYMQEVFAEKEGSAELMEIDEEMFSKAMSFNETRAREFMIPRTEIEAMPVNCSLDELTDRFIETGHSKIIIYEESLDTVLGFAHSRSLFLRPDSVKDILQPVLMVPESMAANVLLTEFGKNRTTVAIVVDEFGGTEGILTIEDLVEEVFGEIDDEHDEPEEDDLLEKQLDENSWMFSSRLEVGDLNENYEMSLPEGDYNTLSGLVMYYAESIPAVNETFEIEGYRFTILDASQNKINTVRVDRLPES